jgi:NAD(P)-dependent dehydrogenase (short-subunit alcohol dehydrogenase family)
VWVFFCTDISKRWTFFSSTASFQYGSIEEVSAEAWSRAFDFNVRSYALMAKHITPLLKKQNSGAIINFASTLGLVAICLIWVHIPQVKLLYFN